LGWQRISEGKKANNIHLGGQILRIADTFDILGQSETSTGFKGIKTILSGRSGSEFSDLICELMISTLESGNFFEEIMDDKRVSEMLPETIRDLPPVDLTSCDTDVRNAVKVFAQVIDAKHSYTAGHSERVARLYI
jgi:HD-GYP domain-containing protein (c-di-GMP phosphodiesterase class II)